MDFGSYGAVGNTQTLVNLVNENSVFGKYYVRVCKILTDRNVPITRLPTKEHFMSRLFICIDEAKLEKWLSKYVEAEMLDDSEMDQENTKEES